ncbi:hypothetical protein M408DRAFT_333206 [Serendipita vermifera MAFF 305830]|uniref:Dynactin subunit 2 n=1 Tax=Serendipita vermifera MAFF 305830 TaxID=933852 RepID=A0A0C3ARI8_SERVB|nr:hypothetical protein M408DRAFT_333206 [Serendipita vermifera MAFF 305830]
MSTKYANLPDIDTAPDVYETEDVEPGPKAAAEDSSDEEGKAKAAAEGPSIEELDPSSLLSAKEARKRFRKAEKRKPRTIYSYPGASGSSSESDSVPATMRSRHKQATQFERLLALKQELASLEREIGDPSSSTTTQIDEQEATPGTARKKKGITAKDTTREDPAELLKGVHDVRARLEKFGTARDNRGRLVDAVVSGSSGITRPTSSLSHSHSHGPPMHGIISPLSPTLHSTPGLHRRDGSMHRREGSLSGSQTGAPHSKADEPVDPGIAKLDSRVGELERIVGSSSAALDESAPLPPPLLPMITRLNTQLTILTQPRTIDSISRRLKLLLTDLDRIAVANPAAQAGTGAAAAQAGGQAKAANGAGATTTVQEQLTPILQRLAPHLPTLPHILARLRTLSSLHAAASDFQRGMEQLESQQARNRSSLNDLEAAVKALEKNMQENGEVEKSNVTRLEANIQGLMERLEAVKT